MTLLCSVLRRRSVAQALNTLSNLRSVSHRSARRGPSAMRWSASSMPPRPENQARGSKSLLSTSASSGSVFSPCCIMRVIDCDNARADVHSAANASFADASSCGSNQPAEAELAFWPAASAMRRDMLVNMLCWAAAKSFPLRAHICVSACMYSNGVTSECHHLSNGLAVMQPVKAEIDLLQLESAAHQSIHGQLAAPVKFDVARQVARWNAGADIASLHGSLLGDKIHLRQRKGMIWRWQARSNGGAAPACDSISEIHGAHGACHFERKFDAAARRGLKFVDRIRAARIERVGCSKLAREAEFVVGQIDCD